MSVPDPALAPSGSSPLSVRRERILLLTLAAVQFTSIVDFMVVMPLGPQLMRTLGIDPRQFGWVVSSYTFAAGLAGLAAAAVLDRFGRKVVFLTLYTGFLVGTLLCGLAPTYRWLLAARIATGAFGGILGGQALAIVGDVFPDQRRGRATGALMSAFALASVAGVPAGLYLGTVWGWHVPFLALAALGLPLLIVAAATMPPLRDHVGKTHSHPWTQFRETLTHPNHLRAYALIVTLMFGAFAVIPYLSAYYVANVGMTETQLPVVFVAGGAVTLVGAPLIGRLADRFGKLRVYRIVAPVSAVMMLVLTHLPPVALGWAALASATLMLSNAGRMVAAMAMITGSVEPRRRGGFMSANSSLQHLATGLGAAVGGLIITQGTGGTLLHFNRVGYIAAVATLLSLWLAGRLRPAAVDLPITTAQSMAAAAAAETDAGDPLAAMESV